jgi:hypothetical protein
VRAEVPFEKQLILADAFAKSHLFGVKTKEEALALMAICEAEGLHPAIAVRDYHIIQGRPALKADAMLARFQQAGGKVQWKEISDQRVSAVFSHAAGGSVEIEWDMARAKLADLGAKDNWKKYPRQMLRARVISEGIRTVYPGCVVGVYTPEEVADMEPIKVEPINVSTVTTAPPQTKAEPTKEAVPQESDADLMEMAAVVEKVEQKSGEKGGKKWTKYFITAGGDKFSTFDKDIATFCKESSQISQIITIQFKVTKYGNDIVDAFIDARNAEEDDAAS